jgi:hypothetical protein
MGQLDDGHVWYRAHPHDNAIGNLILHTWAVYVKKQVEGRAFVIGNLNYLLALVSERLFAAESVAIVLDAVCGEAAKAPQNLYRQIRLDIRQRFGMPPI